MKLAVSRGKSYRFCPLDKPITALDWECTTETGDVKVRIAL
jgi:hypothetical protein